MAAVHLSGCAPELQAAGPRIQQPELRPDAFVAADGIALPTRVWPAEGEPSAVILAVHGFNDYSNAFAAAGDYWAKRGLTTYAYDQRGFGAAPRPGIWPGEETLVADMKAIAAAVSARHPGLPLYLLGESMGGAVVMTAMTTADPPAATGLILVAPAVWGRSTMNPLYRGVLWIMSRTVPWLKLSGRGLDITPSDNIDMLIALGQDPLVIKKTRVDAIKGIVDLMDAALVAAPGLKTQSLVLYGAHDEIIPKAPTATMLESLSGPHRVVVYPEGYHMLLRDLQAETVLADVVAWIEHPTEPLPSGLDHGWKRLIDE